MSKLTQKEAQIKGDNILKEQQLKNYLFRGIDIKNNQFIHGSYLKTCQNLLSDTMEYDHYIVNTLGDKTLIDSHMLFTIGQTTGMYDSKLNQIYENDLFIMSESNKTGIVKRSINNEWVIHYRTDDVYNLHLAYSEDGYAFDMKLENHCYTGSVVGDTYFGLRNENS